MTLILHRIESLHETRGGSVYRDVVMAGAEVLIVNYPGSAGLGHRLQVSAWAQWDGAARATAEAILRYAGQRGAVRLVILGVSFGAWLGAQVAEAVAAEHFIAMSPVVDLGRHIEARSRASIELVKWARERFDVHSLNAGHAAFHQGKVPLTVLLPTSDEVVEPRQTLEAIASMRQSGRTVALIKVPGRHYPGSTDDADARWCLLRRLLLESVANGTASPSQCRDGAVLC